MENVYAYEIFAMVRNIIYLWQDNSIKNDMVSILIFKWQQMKTSFNLTKKQNQKQKRNGTMISLSKSKCK